MDDEINLWLDLEEGEISQEEFDRRMYGIGEYYDYDFEPNCYYDDVSENEFNYDEGESIMKSNLNELFDQVKNVLGEENSEFEDQVVAVLMQISSENLTMHQSWTVYEFFHTFFNSSREDVKEFLDSHEKPIISIDYDDFDDIPF